MTYLQKEKVLAEIAAGFNSADILWGLGASAMLFLRGVAREYHDLDLMTAPESDGPATEILSKLCTETEIPFSPKYESDVFKKYEKNGVEIDLMSGFGIKTAGGIYRFVVDSPATEDCGTVLGQRIPLTTLEDWYIAYTLMGDPKNRVSSILEKLKEKEVSHPLLLRRALNTNLLPQELRDSVNELLKIPFVNYNS